MLILFLQDYISKYNLSDLDRRFFTELVYGVVRRRNYLDAIIVHFAKRPIKKIVLYGGRNFTTRYISNYLYG